MFVRKVRKFQIFLSYRKKCTICYKYASYVLYVLCICYLYASYVLNVLCICYMYAVCIICTVCTICICYMYASYVLYKLCTCYMYSSYVLYVLCTWYMCASYVLYVLCICYLYASYVLYVLCICYKYASYVLYVLCTCAMNSYVLVDPSSRSVYELSILSPSLYQARVAGGFPPSELQDRDTLDPFFIGSPGVYPVITGCPGGSRNMWIQKIENYGAFEHNICTALCKQTKTFI